MRHFLIAAMLFFVAAISNAEVSRASYYGGYIRTASGERFREGSLTAAHKTLPFGSMVRVENVATGSSVDVRINNRGPFISGRALDLTKTAFSQIAPLKQGVVKVKYTVLSLGKGGYKKEP